MTTSNCANCKVTGLPVFPTLYAAVPSSIEPVLPQGIQGDRVKSVSIDKAPTLPEKASKSIAQHVAYKYGLRVARQGYFYVLYESGAKGKWQWDVYVVHGDGCMRLQPSAMATEAPKSKLSCETAGHQVARTHYFVIPDPEHCEQVWMAFSEHKWSAKTLEAMANPADASLRTKRMQPFQPKVWLSSLKAGGHATEATVASVKEVLEYRDGMAQRLTPENAGAISTSSDGRYKLDQLCAQASIHPVQARSGLSEQLIKHMQTSGKRPDGKSHPPVLFALWDATGIVRDLKGYREDAAGRVALYVEKERALQVAGMSMVDGAKLAMENAAELNVRGNRSLKGAAADTRWLGPQGVAALRSQGATKPAPINEHYKETADLIEQWEPKGVPSRYTQRLQALLQQSSLPGWTDALKRPPLEAARTQQLNQLKAEVQAYLNKQNPTLEEDVAKARKEAWPRYEKLIVRDEARLAELRKNPQYDPNKLPYPLETFRSNFDAFLLDADALIDARTAQLIKWLESNLLIDTLTDYDKSELKCGVAFEDFVATAIFGIGSCASGAKKLDTWVNELKADAPANLFWRAFALNHIELEKQINKTLKAATDNKTKFTAAEFGNALSAIDFGKGIYDIYNRAAGIHVGLMNAARAQAQAAPAAAAGAATLPAAPMNLHQQMALADRLLLTAGDRLFKLCRVDKVSDWVGEKVMLHLMNVRALTAPAESKLFIETEIAERAKIRVQATIQAKVDAIQQGHDKKLASVQELKGKIPDAEYDKLLKKAQNQYQYQTEAAKAQKPSPKRLAQIEQQISQEVKQDKASPLRMAWDRFQTDTAKRDAHSCLIRERRLVAIVTLLELVNLSKLIAYDIASQGKDDAKTYAGLVASGMTIAAGAADMTGLSIQYLLNDKVMSFRKIKLFSGTMGVGATCLGAYFDFVDANSEREKGRYLMALLYVAKGGIGFGLGFVSAAATATFAPNTVSRILGKQISAAAVEKFGQRAAGMLVAQRLGLSVGSWITLGLLTIQGLIIWLDDNALEKWCKNSPFGLDAAGGDAYKEAEKMNAALEEAIYDVK